MSAGSSSSGGSKKKIREIKISTKAAGEVDQIGEDTEYTRGNYMISVLRNPIQSSGQKTFVEYYEHNRQSLYSLKIMTELMHENILRCFHYETVVIENSKYYKAAIETFEGSLINIFQKKFATLFVDNYVPSSNFAKLIRSIVEVISFLHRKKMYHGALSWQTLLYTYFGSDMVVKIANFCEKDDVGLYQAQSEDWRAVASMLDEAYNKMNMRGRQLHLGHLIRARDFFNGVISFTPLQRREISNLIRDLDFFWGPEDRRNYAMRIYHWFENQSSRQILEGCVNIVADLPWNNFSETNAAVGNAFLKAMNDFKDEDKNTDYNVNSRVDFLRFVSGLYAHCRTIQAENFGGLKTIDTFICKEFPNLFYELRIIQDQHHLI